MQFFREFKEFAMRGNVVDLAVGVIIGGAFGKIVSSLVNDIMMPPLGYIIGGVDFKHLKLTIKEAVEKSPEVTLNYGQFLQTVIDFTIIAFSVFLMVKLMNTLKRDEDKPKQPPPSPQEVLLTEIRDLLRKSAP